MSTVAAIRRGQIIGAMVSVAHERGYRGASVGCVCARAKVSQRTFYEAFDDLESCFLAVLDEGAERASALLSQAFEREQSWLDGVRGGLAALLWFFDHEPLLAHVLLVEAMAAGAWARERRELHIASLTALTEAHWGAPEDGHMHPLVTAGVMASLLGVLHTHLVTSRSGPLIGLLGPLMGLVTVHYLDRRLVTREIERGDAHAHELLARGGQKTTQSAQEDIELPELLRNPRAHRARACVVYLAEHPAASNRQIARAVGIACHAQISKLLARLAAMGLAVKRPGRPGGPNAWSLTADGMGVSSALLDRRHGEDSDGTQAARWVLTQPGSSRHIYR